MDVQSPPVILVVEDDADVREAVQMLLETEGYDVEVACDGQEAIERLSRDSPPSMILLDLMMPIMDGWQVLGALRATPAWSTIPVAVLSAEHQPRGIEGVSFLRKPFDVAALLSVIERTLPPRSARPLAFAVRASASSM